MTPEQTELLKAILEEMRSIRLLLDSLTQGGDAISTREVDV